MRCHVVRLPCLVAWSTDASKTQKASEERERGGSPPLGLFSTFWPQGAEIQSNSWRKLGTYRRHGVGRGFFLVWLAVACFRAHAPSHACRMTLMLPDTAAEPNGTARNPPTDKKAGRTVEVADSGAHAEGSLANCTRRRVGHQGAVAGKLHSMPGGSPRSRR